MGGVWGFLMKFRILNSHLWLQEAVQPRTAATPRATIKSDGLNQVRGTMDVLP